jgi:translation initiation factor IF-3
VKFYRLNQQIQGATLRVLDQENKQIGVLPKAEALAKALELGLDLVEIAPSANPPVCKIIDFKKFRYLEEKKNRESKKKAKTGGTKELWLGPFMSENDLQVRIERAREFLKEGFRLRLAVKFAGRQITHPEFGWNILRRFTKELEEVGRVEREPKFEGKILATMLTPGRKGKHEQTESKNEEGSGKTLQNNQNG